MTAEAVAAEDPRIGTVLQDRYRILGRLAEGGMGIVYRAEMLHLGRPVAVKFLHDWVVKDPKLLQRFHVEAQAMSRVSHANCVSVIDFGVAGSPYLVMDLVAGTTLRDAISGGVVSASRAISIARQVLSGLAHAHAQGIIHRDIKPENIVLEKTPGFEDHVRILDFGLAKLLGSQANLTLGMVLGTPNYMAPEQMSAGAVDERTDVYAVGIVLFEMLTGKPPFHHDDVGQLFRRKLNMAPPALRSARPDDGHSAALEAVLLRAIARSPGERHANAAAMAAALDAVPEAGRSPPATASRTEPIPPAPRQADRRARVMAVAASVAQRTRHLLRGRASGAALGRALARVRAARGREWVLVGAAFATVVIGVVALRSIGPESSPDAAPVPTSSAAKPPLPASEAPSRAAEVRSLMARGDGESALRVLTTLRRSHPEDPELAALLAQLYFERRWWSEAVAAHREALEGDPTRARDPRLVWHLIGSLQSSRFHRKAAAFLRELGEPVRPLVEKAAREHDSPSVRTRTATLLQEWKAR